jgi:hypothetical protein
MVMLEEEEMGNTLNNLILTSNQPASLTTSYP